MSKPIVAVVGRPNVGKSTPVSYTHLCLADIAPTMLPYIGLPVPAEMTGKSIIAE